MFPRRFHLQRHPGVEIRDRKSRQMRQRRQRKETRPKHDQRRERPHRAAESRPGPCGLRGSLPPQAAQEIAARVLAARRGSSNGVVRQFVIQNRKGGTERTNANHQSTTQASEDSHDPGPSRGVGEGTARPVCRVHRLHSVVRHNGSLESLIQTR